MLRTDATVRWGTMGVSHEMSHYDEYESLMRTDATLNVGLPLRDQISSVVLHIMVDHAANTCRWLCHQISHHAQRTPTHAPKFCSHPKHPPLISSL